MNVTITMDDNGNPIFTQDGVVDMNNLIREIMSDGNDLKGVFADKFKSLMESIKIDTDKISNAMVNGITEVFTFNDSFQKNVEKTIKSKVEKMLGDIKVDEKGVSENIRSLFSYKDKDKALKSVFDKINSSVSDTFTPTKSKIKEKNNSSLKTSTVLKDKEKTIQELSIDHINPNALKAVIMDANILDVDSGILKIMSEKFAVDNADQIYLRLLPLFSSSGVTPTQEGNDSVFEAEAQPVKLMDIEPSLLDKLAEMSTSKNPKEENIDKPDEKTSKWWGIIGGIIGFGVLAWMNKDKIEKWWNESGKPIWENKIKPEIEKAFEFIKDFWKNDLKPLIDDNIIEPINEWFTEKFKETAFYATFLKIAKWWEKPIILKFGDVTGITGDSSFTGIQKIIDKFVLNKIGNFFNIVSAPFKTIGKFFSKFFTSTAGKEGIEAVAEKVAPKLLGFTAKNAGPALTEFLAKRIKLIPGLGAILGLGFGMNRIIKGDISGGLMDVASGIASTLPGLGTAISIALDIINAGRDLKSGGPSKNANTGFNVWWKNELPKTLKKIPFISGLINLAESVGYFMAGDWKSGILKLIQVIPGLDMLSGFFEEDMQAKADSKGVGIGEYVFEGIKNWFISLWDKVMAVLAGVTDDVKQFMLDKVSEKWTSAKEGTTEFFKGLNPFKRSEEKTVSGEDVYTDRKSKSLQIQLRGNDQLETYGKTDDLYAREGGTLDKAITEVSKKLQEQIKQSEIFKTMFAEFMRNSLDYNIRLLETIPMLAQNKGGDAAIPAETSMPDGYIRDPVYEFRMKVRGMGI